MLKFLRPKTPQEFLSGITRKLEGMRDYRKRSFLESNMPAIQSTMQKSGSDLSGNAVPDVHLSTYEVALDYLKWHQKILSALHYSDDEDEMLNTSDLSPASRYFMDETKANVKLAFSTLFKINPEIAINQLAPAKLFETELLEAMASLVNDDYSQLYFDCYDAIDYQDDQANLNRMQQRLHDLTGKALANLLDKDPDLFLFPSYGDVGCSNAEESYLHYLPEGILRERVITENIDKIDNAVRAMAENADDATLNDFNAIYYIFPEEVRPPELTELKKLLLSERIKMCFRMSAADHPELTKSVIALDGETSEYVRSFSAYSDFKAPEEGIIKAYNAHPFIPAYEFIRFENPAAAVDATDKDLGADSKYLWMIRKHDQILVSAFTKADVTKYLKAQTGYIAGEFPNAMEWQEKFCRDPEVSEVALPAPQ